MYPEKVVPLCKNGGKRGGRIIHVTTASKLWRASYPYILNTRSAFFIFIAQNSKMRFKIQMNDLMHN